tara:strand:+ start:325 stop:534 length:210 start_codon:yes stop_codon:yes gene_type:complete
MIYKFTYIKLLLNTFLSTYSSKLEILAKYGFLQPFMSRPGVFVPPTLDLEMREVMIKEINFYSFFSSSG